MSDNIIRIPGITTADGNPSGVLELAKKWDMEHCVIVGHDENGNLCFGGTTSNLEKIITLLERAKQWAIRDVDGDQ